MALDIAVTHTAAAAGTVGGYLQFTNSGSSLTGWPTIVGLRRGVASRPAVHVRTALDGPNVLGVPIVTLGAGEHADAVFAGNDNPGPGQSVCAAPYTALLVTPPHNARARSVRAWIAYANTYLPACTPIVVTMVVPPKDLYLG